MKLQHWTKNKARIAKSSKQSERSDDSDSSQHRKIRSRSREHRSEFRSRNRYDSSDRRMKSSKERSRNSPERSRKGSESLNKSSEIPKKSLENSKNTSEIIRKRNDSARKSSERDSKRSRREDINEKKLRDLHLSSSPEESCMDSKTSSSRHNHSDSSDQEIEQKGKIWGKCDKSTKRKRYSEEKDFSSQDESNVPEQYRTSNFTKSAGKKVKS